LLPVDGDTPIGWLLSLTDLSAERAAEEQRGVLLRFLSHDLRAPHSAILALLDVHRHQAGADSPLFEQIERQVRRALDLTDGFVLLARAESEAYQFQPSLFAMLVLDVLDQALPIAQQKSIKLLHTMDEQSQERLINADQGLLTRALFNLLENAIKYSPVGTTIKLNVSCQGEWLCCELTDQGKGIAAEELPDLFTQYRRFSSAQGIDGVGLGLSMVKAVVDHHGGNIECHSIVDQGTTFRLQLPLICE
jgi:signal transduction histidine kinase